MPVLAVSTPSPQMADFRPWPIAAEVSISRQSDPGLRTDVKLCTCGTSAGKYNDLSLGIQWKSTVCVQKQKLPKTRSLSAKMS